MKKLLEYIVPQLVDHADEVVIEEKAEERGTVYVVHVHPEDMGKIIGKNGRIIHSVRDLVKVVATKHNLYADVVLAQDDNPAVAEA